MANDTTERRINLALTHPSTDQIVGSNLDRRLRDGIKHILDESRHEFIQTTFYRNVIDSLELKNHAFFFTVGARGIGKSATIRQALIDLGLRDPEDPLTAPSVSLNSDGIIGIYISLKTLLSFDQNSWARYLGGITVIIENKYATSHKNFQSKYTLDEEGLFKFLLNYRPELFGPFRRGATSELLSEAQRSSPLDFAIFESMFFLEQINCRSVKFLLDDLEDLSQQTITSLIDDFRKIYNCFCNTGLFPEVTFSVSCRPITESLAKRKGSYDTIKNIRDSVYAIEPKDVVGVDSLIKQAVQTLVGDEDNPDKQRILQESRDVLLHILKRLHEESPKNSISSDTPTNIAKRGSSPEDTGSETISEPEPERFLISLANLDMRTASDMLVAVAFNTSYVTKRGAVSEKLSKENFLQLDEEKLIHGLAFRGRNPVLRDAPHDYIRNPFVNQETPHLDIVGMLVIQSLIVHPEADTVLGLYAEKRVHLVDEFGLFLDDRHTVENGIELLKQRQFLDVDILPGHRHGQVSEQEEYIYLLPRGIETWMHMGRSSILFELFRDSCFVPESYFHDEPMVVGKLNDRERIVAGLDFLEFIVDTEKRLFDHVVRKEELRLDRFFKLFGKKRLSSHLLQGVEASYKRRHGKHRGTAASVREEKILFDNVAKKVRDLQDRCS